MKIWPFGIYRVAGDSMMPTYKAGDTLLGWSWFHPKVGQVVIAWQGRTVVKRVAKITETGIWLKGDNAARSTDSRTLGPVRRDHVQSKIIMRLG